MTRPVWGLTIVGLGPGRPNLVNDAARWALTSGRVFLRTSSHPAARQVLVSREATAFDALLDGSRPWSDAIETLIGIVLDAASTERVVYAVAGNPLIGDATVRALLTRARERGYPVEVIPGVSTLDVAVSVLPAAALEPGLQVVDALDLVMIADQAPFAGGRFPLTPTRPALLTNAGPGALLQATAAALRRVYPPTFEALLVTDETGSNASVLPVALSEMASTSHSWLPAVFIPAADPLVTGRTSDALQQIVARLRAPGGCPWDREQTHLSLRDAVIEEAYEVVDAIERGATTEVQEEFGDLLLQVYLNAQIAEEGGEFTLEDVFDAIAAKLVRRHPHVFGEVEAGTSAEVLTNWERIKQRERIDRGEPEQDHPLGKIPPALPALMRAQTVLRRARRAGLDIAGTADLPSAVAQLHGNANRESIANALLAIAALSSEAGVDAEEALRDATHRLEAQARRAASERTTDQGGWQSVTNRYREKPRKGEVSE